MTFSLIDINCDLYHPILFILEQPICVPYARQRNKIKQTTNVKFTP